MSSNNKKILANLIKSDLRDILANDSRWEADGYYFNDYFMFGDDIWVDTKNQEIENAVKESARLNRNRREEQWKKEYQEWQRQGKKVYKDNFTLFDRSIHADELEKEDYEEIVNLISQGKKLQEQKREQRRKEIEEKLNNTSELYYYGGNVNNRKERSSSWFEYGDKRGSYLGFTGRENNKSYCLEINSNHPILDSFSFEKGFYLIDTNKPIERNDNFGRPWSDGGETNLNNFHKWIEAGDKITITPYNEENGNGLPKDFVKNNVLELKKRDSFCDGCHKSLNNQALSDHFYLMKNLCWEGNEIKIDKGLLIWACQGCYLSKEQEYLQKYNEICETCYEDENGELFYHWIKKFPRSRDTKKSDQSGKDNKAVINFLIRYFQKHNIKKITFENGELVITHNNDDNNETISQENITSELQTVKSFSQRINKKEVSLEELKNIINTDHHSTEKPKDNTILVVCGISGILIIGVVIGLLINKKRYKNK